MISIVVIDLVIYPTTLYKIKRLGDRVCDIVNGPSKERLKMNSGEEDSRFNT